jgi:predicted MFS family arabinose efflux permease
MGRMPVTQGNQPCQLPRRSQINCGDDSAVVSKHAIPADEKKEKAGMFMSMPAAPGRTGFLTNERSWGGAASVGVRQGGSNVRVIGSRPRMFYGWWVVLASALGLFLGPIPILVFSFGVFLRPLVQEFHSGRGAVSLARTLGSTIFAFGVPVVGRLIDRFGARRAILPCTFMVGLILLSACVCSNDIWQLYLFYGVLGAFSSGVGPVSYCAVVSRWFERRRGLAFGVMMLGLGLGALIMPPAAQYLIARFGWRLTLATVGAAVLLVTLPVTALLLKEKPGPTVISPDSDSSRTKATRTAIAIPGMTWREAWHTPDFWLLFCSSILVSAGVTACFSHITPILTDRGTSAQAAGLATSLFGGGLLVGRTASGYLLDRIFGPRVAGFMFGCSVMGMGALQISNSTELAFAAAFLIGLGLGAEVDIMAFLTSRYFGLRSFGTIYGVLFAGFSLAGGAGTYLMGTAFDRTGSYASALALLCSATYAGAVLMLLLGPYRYHGRSPGY